MASSKRIVHGASVGDDVEFVQLALRGAGLDPGPADGIYGVRTEEAVRAYQSAQALDVDGIVGPLTWDRLAAEPGSRVAGPLPRLLAPASPGPEVAAIQAALSAAGFYDAPVDGRFARRTEAAVQAYQFVHGLSVDGVVGPETRGALDRGLGVSPSVARVLRENGRNPVTARAIIALLARDHRQYAGGRLSVASGSADRHATRFEMLLWLARVREMCNSTVVPTLHGRMVILALWLLEADVEDAVGKVAIDALADELDPPLADALSPEGRMLLGKRRRGADTGAPELFARLGPSARTALAYADALRAGDRVHMEHLLAGLLADGNGLAHKLFTSVGLEEEKFRVLVADTTGTELPFSAQPGPLVALPPLSGHAAEAVQRAVDLADLVGASEVSSTVLLRGALSVPGCRLIGELDRMGVSADSVAWEDLVADGRAVDGPIPDAEAFLLARAASDTVPKPGGGKVRAADRLDVARDVEMLASIVLSHDTEPPLAVGLFGNWGTGKSFFMAMMQEWIKDNSAQAAEPGPHQDVFCRDVCQITFNAWHYVDTNLWASLADALFEELARPRDEAEHTRARADEARRRIEQARRDGDAARREARQATGVGALFRAAKAAFTSVATDDGTPGADGKGLRDVERAGSDAASLVREVRASVRTTGVRTLVLALLLTGAIVGALALAEDAPRVLSFGVAASGAAASVVAALRRAVGAVGRDTHERIENAEKEEAAAAAQVEELEQDLAAMNNRPRQLQAFIRERAASLDYRSELGTISRVRRDLEQLVRYLEGEAAHRGRAEAAVDGGLPVVPERIVLYIDDLDRCPREKVVDVLQAVHLLLAFRLFVVVVGVDSRWLERSLAAGYGELLDDPGNYLEKIFQIPFRLRPMTAVGHGALVGEILSAQGGNGTRGRGAPDRTPAAAMPEPAADGADEGGDEPPPAPAIGTGDEPVAVPDVGAATPSASAPARPRWDALVLSDPERALLGRLGGIVTTPRAAKRLVNIYRILRVSVPTDERSAFGPEGGGEYQAVVLLLGILVGRPGDAAAVFAALGTAESGDVWGVLAGFTEVHNSLEPLVEHVTCTNLDVYHRWAPEVARFSFRLGIQTEATLSS